MKHVPKKMIRNIKYIIALTEPDPILSNSTSAAIIFSYLLQMLSRVAYTLVFWWYLQAFSLIQSSYFDDVRYTRSHIKRLLLLFKSVMYWYSKSTHSMYIYKFTVENQSWVGPMGIMMVSFLVTFLIVLYSLSIVNRK